MASRTGWPPAPPDWRLSGMRSSSTKSRTKCSAWRSLPGSDIVTAGSVNFDSVRGGRSTQVSVHLQYAAAGRQSRSARGLALRQGTVADHPRGSPSLQAAARSRRNSTSDPNRIGDAMRAVCWEGKEKISVETVPDPVILNPRDAIIKVTTTAICGSDLHIYDGYIPTMQKGDVLGHEFMGEVVEVGRDNTPSQGRRPRRRPVHHRLRPLLLLQGTAVVALRQLEPECVDGREALRLLSAPGLFGYSHMYGGYAGRPGRIRARAVRRCRPAEGSRRR